MSEKEPKIIVDDDWKSQVQKEKEQLAEEEKTGDAAPETMQLPPASFPVLISTLSTQALASLGFIPDPISGQPTVNRPMAKHFIDTISVLEEKTNGNLTPDEASLVTETLHHLRMAYVNADDNASGSDDSGEKPSTIELP